MPIFYLTALALMAFAANSVLCRLALDSGAIDPVSFTLVRLLGGSVALIMVHRFMGSRGDSEKGCNGSWGSGLALFVYAISFSLAYVSLSSGTGALILFGAVQITMLVLALKMGERMASYQWVGFALAVIGIVYLVSPGLESPDWRSALLMMLSGVAWALYTIAGKAAMSPIEMTMGNFVRASVIALPVSAFAMSGMSAESSGIILALVAGIVTSGLGYVMWYQALPKLETTQAAVLQLLVPLLASFGGVLFISEKLTMRLALASFLILGGVFLSVMTKKKEGA